MERDRVQRLKHRWQRSTTAQLFGKPKIKFGRTQQLSSPPLFHRLVVSSMGSHKYFSSEVQLASSVAMLARVKLGG